MTDIHDRDEIGRKGGSTTGSTTMKRDGVAENVREGWHDFRAKVRAKWNQLTDKDIDTYQTRNRNDLVGYIGQRTGAERTLIERDIDSFARDTKYNWK